jgi:hypothetical protein
MARLKIQLLSQQLFREEFSGRNYNDHKEIITSKIHEVVSQRPAVRPHVPSLERI